MKCFSRLLSQTSAQPSGFSCFSIRNKNRAWHSRPVSAPQTPHFYSPLPTDSDAATELARFSWLAHTRAPLRGLPAANPQHIHSPIYEHYSPLFILILWQANILGKWGRRKQMIPLRCMKNLTKVNTHRKWDLCDVTLFKKM